MAKTKQSKAPAQPQEEAPPVQHNQRRYDGRMSVRIAPATLNTDTREVDLTIATEAPVPMYEWDRDCYVDEVLLMDGLHLDEVRRGKLVLLDSHAMDSVRRVLGSVVELRVDGDQFAGRAQFSTVSGPEFTKVQEGHVDEVSVGYRVAAAAFIEPGESAEVAGKTFTAGARPLKVCTSWTPHEASMVPVGADSNAGTRAQNPKRTKQGGTTMAAKKREQGVDATEVRAPEIDETTEQAEPVAVTTRDSAPTAHADIQVDEDAVRELATRQERKRIADIERHFEPFVDVPGAADLLASVRSEGASVNDARLRLLELLGTLDQPAEVRRVEVKTEERDNQRANFAAGLAIRSGIPGLCDDDERGREFGNRRMIDICRAIVGPSAWSMNEVELAGRAFSHSSGDFPYILANVANKSMLAGYESVTPTWSRWCATGSLPDFKTGHINQLAEAGYLSEVQAGAEYPEHTFDENRESRTLTKFGKIFAITEEAVINDDLGAFTQIPSKHGRAWARTINYQAYKRLLAATTMTDGYVLFSDDHSNLDDSTTEITTVDHASAVIRALYQLMVAQKDLDAVSNLNIMPAFVLCGHTLNPYLAQAIYEAGRGANNRAVDVQRMGLDLIVDAEIENTDINGEDDIVVMLANPGDAPVVQMEFLNGNAAPTLSRQDGFEIDGMKLKVKGYCGATCVDYRGGAKFDVD